MLTNEEVLEMLVQVQEQTGDWRATLDELVDTFEKAVTDEENEAFEKARRTESELFDDTDPDLTDASPFTVAGAIVYDAATDTFSPFDAAGNRYRSDGSLVAGDSL